MANDLTRPAPARQDAPVRRRGRSERRGESYSGPYVEPLGDARTNLADFFSILLIRGASGETVLREARFACSTAL